MGTAGKPTCYLNKATVDTILKSSLGVTPPTCNDKSNTEAVLVTELIKLCPTCGIKPIGKVKDTTVSCAFKSDWCGLQNTGKAKYGGLLWRRQSGKTGSWGTGPNNASTGSYYLYTE